MKKFWIVFLLFFGFSAINNEISAQNDYQLIESVKQAKPVAKLKIPSEPAIQNFIKYYQGGGRITMESGLANSTLHQKMFQRIFREEGVPENLIAIHQTLWMGAAESDGLWLFNSETAKKYGLKKNEFVDETLSFEKATRATAQYLKSLYNKYKNWELVLAAYHSGETVVDKAIKRTGKKDFWKISKILPENTRNFVPNVLATIQIAENPKKYGFEDIDFQSPIDYELVRIAPSIKLEKIAESSEDSIENIKQLNPELISTETPAEPYIIRVPMGKGKSVAEKIRKSSSNK